VKRIYSKSITEEMLRNTRRQHWKY